jgi:hypothetical protein
MITNRSLEVPLTAFTVTGGASALFYDPALEAVTAI